MLMKIYDSFVVFFFTAQHTAFANVPNYGSFADRLVDSLVLKWVTTVGDQRTLRTAAIEPNFYFRTYFFAS